MFISTENQTVVEFNGAALNLLESATAIGLLVFAPLAITFAVGAYKQGIAK